ncbi:MAG: AraC family transcriptional regulator [Gammaproteobacteria bacterium]|nr:AraC family transcriptional regulator [Gammaproteobacteria bacterium]MDH5305286.1 AraC family transcriptional regulator [Gammaproteobacteria bacterium]MDH5323509.1 AraC family transcriptional regulator [Gammaproteobacteria bacterium]
MKLNQLAGDQVATAWLSEPHWYLWDGGFLLLGQSEGIVPAHAHHAIQIVMALDGEPAICTEVDDWQSARGFIVLPDVRHSYDGRGAISAMLFVDPESFEGIWLRTSITQPLTFVSDARLANCAGEIRKLHKRPVQSVEIGPLIRHCVHALCTGAPPLRQPDPRITKSLKRINESKQLRVTLEEIAATVYLSPSRFAHLFSQQLGLPFRHYVLWRKLARAILAIGRGESMTDAAQAADFADAPHLSRTFNRMFGIKPSALMRGEFFEIQSPFHARQ